jgi:hypothetical protein
MKQEIMTKRYEEEQLITERIDSVYNDTNLIIRALKKLGYRINKAELTSLRIFNNKNYCTAEYYISTKLLDITYKVNYSIDGEEYVEYETNDKMWGTHLDNFDDLINQMKYIAKENNLKEYDDDEYKKLQNYKTIQKIRWQERINLKNNIIQYMYSNSINIIDTLDIQDAYIAMININQGSLSMTYSMINPSQGIEVMYGVDLGIEKSNIEKYLESYYINNKVFFNKQELLDYIKNEDM